MLLLIQPEWTPYILAVFGVIAGLQTWLITRSIKQGEDIVALQSAVKYYFETIGKGAAMVLNSPNPTPLEMQELLKKHLEGKLREDERPVLMAWLKTVRDDPSEERGKRNAAYGMLAAVGAMKRLVKSA